MVTETTLSTPLTSAPDAALMFPTLSSAQIARIAFPRAHSSNHSRGSPGRGRPDRRAVLRCESRWNRDHRPSGLGDLLVAAHRPGQFTGEVSMIHGRPALMRVRPRGRAELFS